MKTVKAIQVIEGVTTDTLYITGTLNGEDYCNLGEISRGVITLYGRASKMLMPVTALQTIEHWRKKSVAQH